MHHKSHPFRITTIEQSKLRTAFFINWASLEGRKSIKWVGALVWDSESTSSHTRTRSDYWVGKCMLDKIIYTYLPYQSTNDGSKDKLVNSAIASFTSDYSDSHNQAYVDFAMKAIHESRRRPLLPAASFAVENHMLRLCTSM